MKFGLSIIVPIYNSQKYLRECLDSIIAQTYTQWVCLLVNDGSTDNSQSIIDKYCAKDKRFIALSKTNEKSADLARKYAIDKVDTEWIMHVDADDVIAPDFIKKMVSRQKETGADMVAARLIGCAHEIEGELYRYPHASFDMSQVLTGKEACILNFGGWTWSANAGILYKKALTDKVQYGGYMNSDEYSQRQLSFYAEKVAFCDTQYLYRANEGTSDAISVRIFDRTIVDMQLEQFLYDNYPARRDKISALTKQRFFNLIYLAGDFILHYNQFSNEEKKHVNEILRKSYKALHRGKTIEVLPYHAWMTLLPYALFKYIAYRYVLHKRNNNGTYFYR